MPTAQHNKILLSSTDIFPGVFIGEQNHPLLVKTLDKLLEGLILQGVKEIHVVNTALNESVVASAFREIPREMKPFVKLYRFKDVKKIAKRADHFVSEIDRDSFEDLKSVFEVVPSFIENAKITIFHFLLAQQLELCVPTNAAISAKRVRNLRELLRPGSARARLSLIESVFKGYESTDLSSIKTDAAGWRYLKTLDHELCRMYVDNWMRLADGPRLKETKLSLERICLQLRRLLSTAEIIPKAIDIVCQAPIASLVCKAIGKAAVSQPYAPPYIGQPEILLDHLDQTLQAQYRDWPRKRSSGENSPAH